MHLAQTGLPMIARTWQLWDVKGKPDAYRCTPVRLTAYPHPFNHNISQKYPDSSTRFFRASYQGTPSLTDPLSVTERLHQSRS